MALRARLTPPRETKTDWPWHKVKSSSLRASLLFGGGRRMEAENFLASGFGTRLAIEAKAYGWSALSTVARTWQPSRLKGIQVSRDYGTPFLAATQVFDVRPVPRKWLSLERTDSHAQRFVSPGTILVTCSGSVGRATLADTSIEGALISHDLLRIEAVEDSWWGWTYAYLRAPTVRAMMKAAQYGHIIKHLETHHLDTLPIVRLAEIHRSRFDATAKAVISARDRAHRLELKAEEEFLRAVGSHSFNQDAANGFTTCASAMFGKGRRLEGNFHNPKARAAEAAIRAAAAQLEAVDDLVQRVFVPGRFKHVYGDEGVPYLDSAQILEVVPDIDKRVLSLRGEKQAGYVVDAGTLLIPCSGQLHGIVGSVVLATEWHESKVLTNHILRVVPKKKPTIRIGYLQAVLGHPTLGRPRILKGAFGSSVPEIGPEDIKSLTVPRFNSKVEDAIADAIEEAANLRAQADEMEEQLASEAEDFLNRFLAGDRSHLEV